MASATSSRAGLDEELSSSRAQLSVRPASLRLARRFLAFELSEVHIKIASRSRCSETVECVVPRATLRSSSAAKIARRTARIHTDCRSEHVVPHHGDASAPSAARRACHARAKAAAPRTMATFDETGQQQPTKEANETFVRTPFIGDGYFNDEMGRLYEYTVQVGDSVAADDTVAVVDTQSFGWI